MDRLVQTKSVDDVAKLQSSNPKDVQFGKMIVAGIQGNLLDKMRLKTYRNYSNTLCHREKHRNIVVLAVLMGLLEHDKVK